MADLYGAVEVAMEGPRLSAQGQATLREIVNRQAVNQDLVQKDEQGWQITEAGRVYLRHADTGRTVPDLQWVETPAEIQDNIRTFWTTALGDDEDYEYFVYDSISGWVAPTKFAAFKAMTVEKYKEMKRLKPSKFRGGHGKKIHQIAQGPLSLEECPAGHAALAELLKRRPAKGWKRVLHAVGPEPGQESVLARFLAELQDEEIMLRGNVEGDQRRLYTPTMLLAAMVATARKTLTTWVNLRALFREMYCLLGLGEPDHPNRSELAGPFWEIVDEPLPEVLHTADPGPKRPGKRAVPSVIDFRPRVGVKPKWKFDDFSNEKHFLPAMARLGVPTGHPGVSWRIVGSDDKDCQTQALVSCSQTGLTPEVLLKALPRSWRETEDVVAVPVHWFTKPAFLPRGPKPPFVHTASLPLTSYSQDLAAAPTRSNEGRVIHWAGHRSECVADGRLRKLLVQTIIGTYFTDSQRTLLRTGFPELQGGNVPPIVDHSLARLAQELFLPLSFLEKIEMLLKDKRQVIFYGPPGTGKTYVARKLAQHFAETTNGQVEKVQFHPSYAYEDFVQGFRPRTKDGQTVFKLINGPLLRLAKKAAANPGTRNVLLIDELNRGNIAKIFGELYFLLEYRDEEMRLQYGAQPFKLPKDEFWIIGTMNTADRSIALVDAALRRRFHFVPFFPDREPIRGLLGRWLAANCQKMAWVAGLVERVNGMLDNRHLSIGPSHFLRRDLDQEKLAMVWEHSVIPYLQEQFFGQEERLVEFELERLRTGQSGSTVGDVTGLEMPSDLEASLDDAE